MSSSECSQSQQFQISVGISAFVDCSQTSSIATHRFIAQLGKSGTNVEYPSLNAFTACINDIEQHSVSPPNFSAMSTCYDHILDSALMLPMIKMDEDKLFEHMISSGIIFDESYCQCNDWINFGDSPNTCPNGAEVSAVVETARSLCSQVRYEECAYLDNWATKCYNSITTTLDVDGVDFRHDVRQCQMVTVGECGVGLNPPIVVHKSDCGASQAYRLYSAWKEACSPLNDGAHYNSTDGKFRIDAAGVEGGGGAILFWVLAILSAAATGFIAWKVVKNKRGSWGGMRFRKGSMIEMEMKNVAIRDGDN